MQLIERIGDRVDVTDEGLLVQARGGDTEAFGALVATVGRGYCLGFWPSFAVAPDGSAYAVNTLAMPIPGAGPKDGLFVVDAATLEARYLGDFFGSTVTWQPEP